MKKFIQKIIKMSNTNTTSNVSNITIVRALVYLKTLNSRIEKARRDCVLITHKMGKEPAKASVTEDKYQKIITLIENRKRVKAAIVLSNANTVVNVNGKQYTIAEAIERKSSIDFEKTLLTEMKQQLSNETMIVENANMRVQKQLDKLLEVSFQNGQKNSPEEMKTFSDNYTASNKAELVDPLKLAEKINKLENDIIQFESEVDLALSESNAKTMISVDLTE